MDFWDISNSLSPIINQPLNSIWDIMNYFYNNLVSNIRSCINQLIKSDN